jgi:hypothetical protein
VARSGENTPRFPGRTFEVLSPGNTEAELREKAELYFDAGAVEVWHCADTGRMTFFRSSPSQLMKTSQLCPEFSTQID